MQGAFLNTQGMDSPETSNTYELSCQVVEIIYREGTRTIKTMCNPGSLIIETPDTGKAQLGDRLIITGKFHIQTVRTVNSSDNH